jgi:hypothetical protein
LLKLSYSFFFFKLTVLGVCECPGALDILVNWQSRVNFKEEKAVAKCVFLVSSAGAFYLGQAVTILCFYLSLMTRQHERGVVNDITLF